MTYEEWEASVPAVLRNDVIWRVQAYRLGSFLAAAAQFDTDSLVADRRLARSVTQLCEAAGSVPAHISEGYVKLSPKDRLRYYGYGHGSAAEARSWYLTLHRHLPEPLLTARIGLIRSIIRLLQTMIRSERNKPDSP